MDSAVVRQMRVVCFIDVVGWDYEVGNLVQCQNREGNSRSAPEVGAGKIFDRGIVKRRIHGRTHPGVVIIISRRRRYNLTSSAPISSSIASRSSPAGGQREFPDRVRRYSRDQWAGRRPSPSLLTNEPTSGRRGCKTANCPVAAKYRFANPRSTSQSRMHGLGFDHILY